MAAPFTREPGPGRRAGVLTRGLRKGELQMPFQ